MNSGSAQQYLRLLGIARRKPGREALEELVRAHLICVPFENISKLYYKKRFGQKSLPSLEQFLDGIERNHFGGTCYANNGYLNLLLAELGYETKLCGAGMRNPDVHVVSIVRVDGREYLVDGGYAAPFLRPLPLDWDHDYELLFGEDRYVLSPRDAEGRSRLTLYRAGIENHGYIVNPLPRDLEHFESVMADSFRPSATFMNAVLIVQFSDHGSRVLHNDTLIDTNNGRTTRRKLADRNEIASIADTVYGIPRGIVAEVLDEVPVFRDAWG